MLKPENPSLLHPWPTEVFAIFTAMNGDEQLHFSLKDHQDSLAVLADAEGRLVGSYNYDAFGHRHDAENESYNNISTSTITDGGYAFHEHLDQFGLLNMLSKAKSRSEAYAGNGRVGVYPERQSRFGNPIVGRMLSPDLFIQAPGYSQSLNRYSYCWNNPLKYTDPTGYELGVENRNNWHWYEYRGGINSSQGIGPGSSNHWSDKFRLPNHNFMLGNQSSVDKIHGNGTYEYFAGYYTGDNQTYVWNPVAGHEVYRESSGRNVYVYYSGDLLLSKPNFSYDLASDGNKVTFEQAKIWYQFGGGSRMDVDLNSIDLSKVRISDFNSRGLVTVRLYGKHFSNLNDALVHGTITLQRIGNTNQARVALNSDDTTPEINGQPAGMYDFTMHSLGEPVSWIRNPLTFAGGIINGLMPVGGTFIYVGGTPFPIYYNGTTTIQP